MKDYIITDEDIEAINRLLDVDENNASITRDETEHTPFECGILSESGYLPVRYGGGKTIALAINEALATQPKAPPVSETQINRAMSWLKRKGIKAISRPK